MPKRVCVLSASVGAGHVRAGEAVAKAVKEVDPLARVIHCDVLSLTNKVFRRLYGRAYFDLVEAAPHMVAYLYDLMDRPREPHSPQETLRKLTQRANLGKLIDMLLEEPWDVFVNTHFLPTEIIATLKRRRKLRSPQITVTTDFDTHRLWVHPPCEQYTTANRDAARYLVTCGVDAATITVTGIPIDPIFARTSDREWCAQKHGLDASRPVILQMAGGFGIGPIATIFEQLCSIRTPLQVVVVTGKNEKARKQLDTLDVPPRHRASILGYTTEMHELMTVADIVVSKPGGLTVSETLARGGVFAIVNPIPGQEDRNSDFLLEAGCAIKCNSIATLGGKLGDLIADSERMGQLRANARRVGRPRAAYDVAELALKAC